MAFPDKISVSTLALSQVLQALAGPAYFIRELQATRSPQNLFPDNPINILIDEFNSFVDTHNGTKATTPSSQDDGRGSEATYLPHSPESED